ncbi:MAG TPA: HGGxSTG domain-containing protein [Gammaproteobacteria bacterium]|jgi:hypothetical protein|nr:HGGxSTG domain-containing protein [Gammaproteobacteria bacterium]
MSYGRRLGYDWRMDSIRFTTKTLKLKRGDWSSCGAYRKRDGQPCQAWALDNGCCKYHEGLSTGPRTPKVTARAVANLKHLRRPQRSANFIKMAPKKEANYRLSIADEHWDEHLIGGAAALSLGIAESDMPHLQINALSRSTYRCYMYFRATYLACGTASFGKYPSVTVLNSN